MEMKLDVRRRAEKQPDAIGAGPKMGDGTFAYRRYFAAQDRINQLEAEVELFRDRAARAEA